MAMMKKAVLGAAFDSDHEGSIVVAMQDMISDTMQQLEALRINLNTSGRYLNSREKATAELLINSRLINVLDDMKTFAICGDDGEMENAIEYLQKLQEMKRLL